MNGGPVHYTQAELDDRLRAEREATAAALKAQGIDKSLASIRSELRLVNKKLLETNHLRRDMATKGDIARLESQLERVVKIDDFGEGGIDTLKQQVKALRTESLLAQAAAREHAKRSRWSDHYWGRASISAGIVGGLGAAVVLIQKLMGVWPHR